MTYIPEIARLLSEQKATLSTAESCTGGLIGHLLTNFPGSSNWYQGGVVSYSNDVKTQMLGVKAETLERVGAVSEQVAEQMATGARTAFGTTYAVSVTGIAGPDGTDDKPAGLTYIGVAGPAVVRVKRYQWQGSREANKLSSAHAALEMLQSALSGESVTPPRGKPTAVEVRLTEGGKILPIAFVWNGRTLKITDWGRRSEEDNALHCMVMTGRGKAWELQYDRLEGVWSVREVSRGARLV